MLLKENEIGTRVADLREAGRMSVGELAASSGISLDELAAVEGGAIAPAQMIAAIAGALGTSPETLLRADDASIEPLFRSSGHGSAEQDAVRSADKIVDDFFALEALTRA